MSTDDDLHEFDLDAWAPPPPAAGLADAVIARARRDGASASTAVPADAPAFESAGGRRSIWPAVLGASLLSASAAAAITFFAVSTTDRGQPMAPPPTSVALGPAAPETSVGSAEASDPAGAPLSPEITAIRPRHIDLGGVIGDLDAGAAIQWQHVGSTLQVRQLRGVVTYRANTHLVINTDWPASSIIDASGASLRVEVPMNLTDVHSVLAPTLLATSAVLVGITVYDGHVRATAAGQTLDIAAGHSADIAPKQPPQERADVGVGAATGAGLTAEQIDHTIRGKAGAFRACYQHALEKTPGLSGKLVLDIEIGSDGVVASAAIASSSTMNDPDVSQCTTTLAATLKFPASGGESHVRYPFVFSPGVGASASGHQAESPPANEVLTGDQIRLAIGSIEGQMLECGTKLATHGTVKLTVVVQPDGSVSDVTVKETPDAELGKCAANQMRTVEFAKSRSGITVTYSFAL